MPECQCAYRRLIRAGVVVLGTVLAGGGAVESADARKHRTVVAQHQPAKPPACLKRASCAEARLDRVNLGHASLAHEDFSGARMRGANLTGANLGRAVFREASLGWSRRSIPTSLAHAHASQADFWRARMDRVQAMRLRAPRAIFAHARLAQAVLAESQLQHALFAGAVLRHANLDEADLSGADLRHADLRFARLTRADLTGARLDHADLEGARLDGAKLDHEQLRHAHLCKTRLADGAWSARSCGKRRPRRPHSRGGNPPREGHKPARKGAARAAQAACGPRPEPNCEGVNRDNVTVTNTDVHRCRCKSSSFRYADLRGNQFWESDFTWADLTGANLTGTNLWHSNFYGATATSAFFDNANLQGAALFGTNLDASTFRNANLVGVNPGLAQATIPGTSFRGAELSGADLSGANLYMVPLTNAKLKGANLTNARLSWANLTGADLSDAVLRGADTGNAIFSATSFCRTVMPDGSVRNPGCVRDTWYDCYVRPAPDCTGAKRPGVALSGGDVSRCRCSWADFSNGKLTDADFHESDFSHASLAGTDLSRTEASSSDFYMADLTSARLDGAKVGRSAFFSANLTKASLRNANAVGINPGLQEGTPSGTVLHQADLGGADLTGSNLYMAEAIGASFKNTNLTNADLRWANLNGADLSGAILKGARTGNLQTVGAIFCGTIMPGGETNNSQCEGPDAQRGCRSGPRANCRFNFSPGLPSQGADWTRGDFTAAQWEYSTLRDSDFSDSNLTTINLIGADVSGAKFKNANLGSAMLNGVKGEDADFSNVNSAIPEQHDAGTQFMDAKLAGASFRGANLHSANFTGADLRGVDFTGANISNALFTGADLRGADFTNVIGDSTQFGSADMQMTDWTGAFFAHLYLDHADLTGANIGIYGQGMPDGGTLADLCDYYWGTPKYEQCTAGSRMIDSAGYTCNTTMPDGSVNSKVCQTSGKFVADLIHDLLEAVNQVTGGGGAAGLFGRPIAEVSAPLASAGRQLWVNFARNIGVPAETALAEAGLAVRGWKQAVIDGINSGARLGGIRGLFTHLVEEVPILAPTITRSEVFRKEVKVSMILKYVFKIGRVVWEFEKPKAEEALERYIEPLRQRVSQRVRPQRLAAGNDREQGLVPGQPSGRDWDLAVADPYHAFSIEWTRTLMTWWSTQYHTNVRYFDGSRQKGVDDVILSVGSDEDGFSVQPVRPGPNHGAVTNGFYRAGFPEPRLVTVTPGWSTNAADPMGSWVVGSGYYLPRRLTPPDVTVCTTAPTPDMGEFVPAARSEQLEYSVDTAKIDHTQDGSGPTVSSPPMLEYTGYGCR